MSGYRTVLTGKGKHHRAMQRLDEGLPAEPKRRRRAEASYHVARKPTLEEAVRAMEMTGSASNAGDMRRAETAELDRRCEPSYFPTDMSKILRLIELRWQANDACRRSRGLFHYGQL